MNIKGRFVTLRAATESDQEFLLDMLNDPDLENCVVGWSFPLSIEQQLSYFRNHLEDSAPRRFVIEDDSEGPLGIANLAPIDWKNRCAEHGIKLANQSSRMRGVGTDAVMAVMRYAFDELGMHRLSCSRFSSNIASKKLYEKCGWKQEGIRRELIYKGGAWRDVVMMGILREEYEELIKSTRYWD